MTQNKYQNTLNTCSQRQFSTHLNLPNVDLQFFDRREALIAGHGSTWSKAMQDNSEGWCTDATYMHTCRAQTAVPPLHSRGMFIDNEAPTRKARVEELTLIWSRPHAASLTGKLSNDCSYSFSLSLVYERWNYDTTWPRLCHKHSKLSDLADLRPQNTNMNMYIWCTFISIYQVDTYQTPVTQ